MLRVLHVYAGNLYGGVETLLTTLARHRALGAGMEPEFALCFEGRLSDELIEAGVPVHWLGQVRTSRPWTLWHGRRCLDALLQRERPDAVLCHACWPHALFAPVVRQHGLPLIFWTHDVLTGRHWLERWSRRTPPDLVLCNSRFTRATVSSVFAGVPSEVIYLPVSTPEWVDRLEVRRQVRAELQASEQAVVIVQTSRLERWKGHVLLLQALGRLRDLPGWVCWIAGGTQRPGEISYLDELKVTAAASGIAERVRFLGQRSDVPRLLAAADIHCQPNIGPEPFGIAFVEALLARLPVVTTAMGGAMEIIDDTCGVLVPPGAVPLLSASLRRLVEDASLRTALGGAGPARARALCDPAQQISQLESILHGVVRQRAAT